MMLVFATKRRRPVSDVEGLVFRCAELSKELSIVSCVKIGIACSGLDHIRRGFETFAEDLFRMMQTEKDLDVVLFKGNGRRAPREEVLWNIPRDSDLWGGWTSFIPWKG